MSATTNTTVVATNGNRDKNDSKSSSAYDPFDHLFDDDSDDDDDDDDDDIFLQGSTQVSPSLVNDNTKNTYSKHTSNVNDINTNTTAAAAAAAVTSTIEQKGMSEKIKKKKKSKTITIPSTKDDTVLLGNNNNDNTSSSSSSNRSKYSHTSDFTLRSSQPKASPVARSSTTPPPPVKRKELEIIGYPWGRNKTYSRSAVCRFVVEKIIRNDIFPGARPKDIPINALYELPTYSPFIEFHLVVAFDESNSKDVTASGTHIFMVLKIISCKTRLINEKTMREYLIRLYNCSNGRLYDTTDMTKEEYLKRRRQDDDADDDDAMDNHILKKRLTQSYDGDRSSRSFKLEKTSPLFQASLSAEFLGKTMDRISRAQRQAKKPLSTPGQVWYKKYVYPLVRHWPKSGLTLDNVEFYLKQLYDESKKFQASLNQTVTNTTTTSKHTTGEVINNNNSFSDIYTIIYSKIKPCLRGALFEHMLIYFHESFLHALSPSQQLAIYYLMNEKPEIMMFWRMTLFYLSLIKHTNSKRDKSAEDTDEDEDNEYLFHNNRDIDIQTSSRRKDYANFKDRLLSTTHLYYDPTMPMWSIAKYQMFIDARQHSLASTAAHPSVTQQVIFSALEIFLNVDQHYYYSGNTAIPYFATPDLFRGNAFYCDILSSKNRPGLEFLLAEKIFMLCKNTASPQSPPRMMQPLNFYAEEEKLVRLLVKVQSPAEPLLLIDSNFVSSYFLKRLVRVIKELSDAFQSRASFKPDGSVEPVSIRIYSCNEQVARYQSSALNLKVSNIFDDSIFTTKPATQATTTTATTSVSTDDTATVATTTTTTAAITHLIVLSAHKIPMNRISQLVEKLAQENGGRPFSIVICADSEDFTNRNYKNHTFISFRGLEKIPSIIGDSVVSRFKYEQWKIEALRHELTDQSKSVRKSVESYLAVKHSKQAKLNEISLKNFKEIIKCYKDLEKDYMKDPLNNTYVILCSNEPTKKRLLTLMFEDKKKTYAQFSFLCKNYVFIEQSNTRGKIQQAFLIEDDKSNSEVATTQVMDIRRNEHLIKVSDRFYSTEKTSVEHSAFELVANYSGPPVKTVVFVVSERTSRHDLLVAAKYATDNLKIYYSYNTSFTTLVESQHYHSSDFTSKLVSAFQQQQQQQQ